MSADASLPRLPQAPGRPGIPPRWTRSAKDAIGTAYASSSKVWFTLAQGTLTEIYYPTIDLPQVRDLQFLFTDGSTFFHTERRDCDATTALLADDALGYSIVTADRQARYRCHKEVIADPHLSCVLVRARVECSAKFRRAGGRLRLFVLCAPHLGGGGAHNNARVVCDRGRALLLANRDAAWMALAASVPFLDASAGFVGSSDGWSDLAANLRLDHRYDAAIDGNVALVAEVDADLEFTLALAFGDTDHAATNTAWQALAQPYARPRERFLEQWGRAASHCLPLDAHSLDGGRLYRRSLSLLLAHEDKSYPGALIASLSIPWGETKGDEDLGGYHLVWTRDLCNSATGLLAAGDLATPLRALIYLATAQHPDGGFAQNFWIDGRPYWNGIQLDEVAFPILLAWRLRHCGGLADFDPYPMVAAAAGFLMRHGPATQQERWEEAGGYSPSTLAAVIAALVCAADLARRRGGADATAVARLALEYADFLEAHLEAWTVTARGSLLGAHPRHFVRINPAPLAPGENPGANEDLDAATLRLANQPPGTEIDYAARDIVDAGFLELVRYGIRAPGDPLIAASLEVVDAVLKTTLPAGDVWRRYNHDGYGQQDDGDAFNRWGRGRPWPLLSGERAHYELACGRSTDALLRALEQFANHQQLLPEQVWDAPDLPDHFLHRGRPTGGAMPLLWAHAEYVKLLRSRADGAVFDLLPPVAARYAARRRRSRGPALEIWSLRRQLARAPRGARLRILLEDAFVLHASHDQWTTVFELPSTPTPLGFEYVDVTLAGPGPFRFTWRESGRPDGDHWLGRDFAVDVADVTAPAPTSAATAAPRSAAPSVSAPPPPAPPSAPAPPAASH